MLKSPWEIEVEQQNGNISRVRNGGIIIRTIRIVRYVDKKINEINIKEDNNMFIAVCDSQLRSASCPIPFS